MEPIKLVALREPLAPIEFPNGRVLPVREIDGPTKRLIAESQADPANEPKLRAVLAAVCPDATDDDWDSCTTEDMRHFFEHAYQKEATVQALIAERQKNASAGSVPPPADTRPSNRTTKSRTSAPASPGPTAATTGP